MLYICNQINKTTDIMKKFDAYFYSFYFYFTRNCEAGSCV